MLAITVPVSAPVGTYTITILYQTDAGVQSQAQYSLSVVDSYLPVKRDTLLPIAPPLAAKATWESNMAKYGREHCGVDSGTYEGQAWYYDGIRVYYQIADYLQDQSFISCALHEVDTYRGYVITYSGNIPMWRFFARGLAMDYQRRNDLISRDAVAFLDAAARGSFPAPQANFYPFINPAWTRELSYTTEAIMVSTELGAPAYTGLQTRIELLMGHFEQWFISKTATPQPFMVALACEALIEYYDATGDGRVPSLIQLAADNLWQQSWDSGSGSFLYANGDGTTTAGYSDLNLLIVPLYGWIYQYTGDDRYRNWGDQIFTIGVTSAYLDGGKQFSQNYRWSMKYIGWRDGSAQVAFLPRFRPRVGIASQRLGALGR
jgi:hypothetical protein